MSYTPENIPFVDGMTTGMGVNLVNGETTSVVFTNGVKTTVSQKRVPTIYTSCVETSDDYSALLNIVAGVEGQAWTEDGDLSVSASGSFLSKQRINQQSVAFVSYRAALTQAETPSAAQMNSLTLSSEMQQQILNDPTGFLNEYGTHVITGFIYGGSIMVCINIRAYSQDDVTNIKAAFSTAINEFELGSAKITSSFASLVKDKSSLFSTSANLNGVGVSVPSISLTNLDDVQDYIDGTGTYVDSGFVDELGVGVKVMAVCQPWEALPCVTSIQGYKPGTLSPPINMSFVDELRNENRRLSYGIQTTDWMQENNCWVGPISSGELQADSTALSSAQGAIQRLTIQDLSNLNSSNVGSYIVSQGILSDLAEIAGGRTSFSWWANLDTAFTPNSQNGAITGSLVTLPQTATIVVLKANHGDATASLGILYTVAPVTTPTPLQSRVSAQASFQFGSGTPTLGPALQPGATQPSEAAWTQQYNWNNISIVYSSSATFSAAGD